MDWRDSRARWEPMLKLKAIEFGYPKAILACLLPAGKAGFVSNPSVPHKG